MGCYNYTCAVSRLPILSGDPVVLMLIAKNRFHKNLKPNDSLFEPSAVWEPFGFPIYAKYNDYGWVEDEVKSEMLYYTLGHLQTYNIYYTSRIIRNQKDYIQK